MKRAAWIVALGAVLVGSCNETFPARVDRAGDVRTECASAVTGMTKATFHGDRTRLGWNDREDLLGPARVGGGLALAFVGDAFASFVRDGQTFVGRAYASPLYADDLRIATREVAGAKMSVVFTATSNGDVYATSAFDATCAAERTIHAGTTLWQAHLVTPSEVPRLDARFDPKDGETRYGGIPLGILSTPVLDRDTETLYVTAMDAGRDGALPVWKIFALDTSSGAVRDGWPIVFTPDAVKAKNTNGPASFADDARTISQRSALALSADGTRVYVAFGGYWDEAVGWIVAIDTRAKAIAASFSGAADVGVGHANAGMWAPGGPAIDELGRVYVTTGNSPEEDGPKGTPRTWGNSLLRLTRDLVLDAAYTPWDYCVLDGRDVDLAGSSPILVPNGLVAIGGKAGVVYLLDRDRLPPPGAARPACARSFEDAARDASLLPPEPAEPYCDGFTADPCAKPSASSRCVRGPLWVFGPQGDDAAIDHAKMRTTPAFFSDDQGNELLFVAGSTKVDRCTAATKPPSTARLAIRALPDGARHLAIDAQDEELAFVNPGSPVVTSHEGKDPVVWVVDQNARRTQPLLDPSTPGPVLYAVDGRTMRLLWRSPPNALAPGGKYTTAAIAHGRVFVATDRLHAFSPR